VDRKDFVNVNVSADLGMLRYLATFGDTNVDIYRSVEKTGTDLAGVATLAGLL